MDILELAKKIQKKGMKIYMQAQHRNMENAKQVEKEVREIAGYRQYKELKESNDIEKIKEVSRKLDDIEKKYGLDAEEPKELTELRESAEVDIEKEELPEGKIKVTVLDSGYLKLNFEGKEIKAVLKEGKKIIFEQRIYSKSFGKYIAGFAIKENQGRRIKEVQEFVKRKREEKI